MAITLNHTIVPVRDKVAAARFFARIFGVSFDGSTDHFAPERVNKTLTFLFEEDSSFESHHHAFHVSDTEFDASVASRRPGSRMAALPGISTTASSTIGTAAGAFTSRTRMVTCLS